jgi:hypothetical protein
MLAILLFPLPAFANNICYGVNDYKNLNRFRHCKRGDAITVLTLMETREIKDLNNVDFFISTAIRIDEVSSFCDYDHVIVPIGEISTPHYPLKYFNCTYLGKRREGRSVPDKLPR